MNIVLGRNGSTRIFKFQTQICQVFAITEIFRFCLKVNLYNMFQPWTGSSSGSNHFCFFFCQMLQQDEKGS